MKSSEVIELAMNHPQYLTDYRHLCNVIRFADELQEVDTSKAMRAVQNAVGSGTLLKAFWDHGLMEPDQKQDHPDYKTLALQFWGGLIEQLREQGD